MPPAAPAARCRGLLEPDYIFTIACLVALGFFVGWAIYWRDLPELLPECSHPGVGIID